jgi:hypothetical protein
MRSRQIAIFGWRGRVVFDAYLRLPDGMGSFKEATESYVDLCETRGHSLAVTTMGWEHAGPEASVRSEIYRLSSDSRHYLNGGWSFKRPDWFHKLDTGTWGLREEIYTQAKELNVYGHPILAGVLPFQKPEAIPHFSIGNEQTTFDENKLYLFLSMSPEPQGELLIKFGHSYDPPQRRGGLQGGNPYPIIPIIAIEGRRSFALENKVHTLLDANRMMGEWFRVTIADYGNIFDTIIRHNLEEAFYGTIRSCSTT